MMTASTLFALSIVFHGWAEIQWRQQHFDQATSAAKLSLTLNPFSPRTHATLGKIIWSQSTDRENLELALQSVNNAVRFQPENIQLLLMKSQLLVSLGRTQEAVQLLEKTTARAPFRGEVRSELKRLTQTPAPD
jgi:predicted Zn-dependent protease